VLGYLANRIVASAPAGGVPTHGMCPDVVGCRTMRLITIRSTMSSPWSLRCTPSSAGMPVRVIEQRDDRGTASFSDLSGELGVANGLGVRRAAGTGDSTSGAGPNDECSGVVIDGGGCRSRRRTPRVARASTRRRSLRRGGWPSRRVVPQRSREGSTGVESSDYTRLDVTSRRQRRGPSFVTGVEAVSNQSAAHRAAPPSPHGERRDHGPRARRVGGAEGFVYQDHVGGVGQGASDLAALLHPAREVVQAALGHVGEAATALGEGAFSPLPQHAAGAARARRCGTSQTG
jgi:hypothetical protein